MRQGELEDPREYEGPGQRSTIFAARMGNEQRFYRKNEAEKIKMKEVGRFKAVEAGWSSVGVG